MDRGDLLTQYLDTLPFSPYPFQEEALLAWFECTGGALICAPTGMGKTLLAEAAIFEALQLGRRLYYTTPLIALTDQKFRELQALVTRWGFSPDQVGLITGNRKVNAEAPIRVVVAEILLNHLLSADPAISDLSEVSAVVMDEFHNFNDPERGIVWELALVLLPPEVRVLLLSATVGNPYDFADWLRREFGRRLATVVTAERKVPLEYQWVEDRSLTELLPSMNSDDDEQCRAPALVFCFNRDECWDVAETLKGLPLIRASARTEIEAYLSTRPDDLREGVGPKLRQMLIRGVGVHHAGVLPMHKQIVEDLFQRKLVPFVICTETLAAGINLPARAVVLSTLIKGKPGERKLIPAAAAHQMFGRAGRPQFDTRGFVFAVAHEDDVRIFKWKKKFEQIDPNSKDPGIMRMRKELERKRPTRRKTEQYWSAGQFRTLIEAGPARLASRSMIPYPVLTWLLTRYGALQPVRDFLGRRFAGVERIDAWRAQLDYMLGNLAQLGYLTRSEDGDHVVLHESIGRLLNFRSIDPLFGVFLVELLARASLEEKLIALDAVLQVPPAIERNVRLPFDRAPGPLETEVLAPLMVQIGAVIAQPNRPDEDPDDQWLDEEDESRPPSLPEMLKLAFEHRLANPEPVFIQPKWILGDVLRFDGEFYKFVRARDLVKQEGIILRHLLRLVILAGEFRALTEDPDYERVGELATRTCERVDRQYTEHFLADAAALRRLTV
jgi:superfamily II DNA/RNA helicase